jgi:hypothetical protein
VAVSVARADRIDLARIGFLRLVGGSTTISAF